jgi:hypothetical protein
VGKISLIGSWKNENGNDISGNFYKDNEMTLGDFNELVRFLLITSGSKDKIEKEVVN